MSELCYKLREDDSTELREQFNGLEAQKIKIMREKVTKRVELCMRHQRDSKQVPNFENLFKWTKKLMCRDGFLDMNDAKNEDEVLNELDKSDETFVNSDPNFDFRLDDFKSVQEVIKKATVDGWDPLNDTESCLADFIAKKKKIDKFYKCHAAELAAPIFTILKMIENSDHFPSGINFSKLTLLPSRSIFSLQALPKIVESILALEYNASLQKMYENDGDPLQMAYEPDRGTTSCNAITYTEVDIANAKGKACIQGFLDAIKAFNTMPWGLIFSLAQRVCGGGALALNRAIRRYYIHGEQKRGQTFDQGVMAGEPLAVF
jgi:hypothetical protein